MSIDTTDPFAQPTDTTDPFATPEDTKGSGGPFVPSPSLDALGGRLVAMIPRKFEKRAPKPEAFRQNAQDTTRERYTVDLYVLDPGTLTFWYNAKVEGSTEREPTEYTVEISQGEPFHVPNFWVVQGAVIGQIRNIDGGPRPILAGRVRRGPQAADRGKKDFAKIEAEWTAYERRNKAGAAPKFSWQVDNAMSADDLSILRSWWTTASANGLKITTTEVVD